MCIRDRNYEDEVTRAFGEETKAQVLFFSSKRKLDRGIYLEDGSIIYHVGEPVEVCKVDELQILGTHNYENVMAAVAMAAAFGVPMESIRRSVKAFGGVEHRIEFVAEKRGVAYYNDSKGTNPDAAIRGIQAMNRPTYLIGGGYDKDSTYEEWIEEMCIRDSLYTAETMQETDLATNSFGQNFNVTMTQMVAAFASLINGGYYYEPHVVKQIQDENGSVIETKDPTLLRKTISAETSAMVKEYMRATMEYGTGTPANIPGYEIGAKTGTAEKLPRGNGNYLLSYIGYAPQENPEVIVYVVVDEPNVADQSTSRYVLELAQKIMAQAFPYLNISTVDGYVPTETMPVPADEEAGAAAQAAGQPDVYKRQGL